MACRQLHACKTLFQAGLQLTEQCKRLVPQSFCQSLLEALQHLMLEAVQEQQREQIPSIQACLEAALQLLSRVGSLGPIEAFFVVEELLHHFQARLEAIHVLLYRLEGDRTGCKQPGRLSSSDTCKLRLPEQQQQVVQSFRQQAARLCPNLAHSCSPDALQQLCDTVRQGLVLVNGHSFLLGQISTGWQRHMQALCPHERAASARRPTQAWQAEAEAMLARAEQLKVVLAHRQAHHLSLLASVLQQMHEQEMQQFEAPRSKPGSPAKRQHATSATPVQQCQHLQGPVPVTCHGQLAGQIHCEVEEGSDDDDFFLPVAPVDPGNLGSSCGSPGTSGMDAAHARLLALPFHMPADSACSVQSDNDSLVRMPSSGCSSLLEYVQNASKGLTQAAHSAEAPQSSSPTSISAEQQYLEVEQQLLSITGSDEIAGVLATALGLDQVPCSCRTSYCGAATASRAGSITAAVVAADREAAAPAAGVDGYIAAAWDGRASSDSCSPISTSKPASVITRLSSSAAKMLAAAARSGGAGSPPCMEQQLKQRQRHRHLPLQAGKALCLQHVQLPAGCCKNIGVVCYLCPHLRHITLVDVNLTDEAVGDLVDALKVNSSITHVDLSHNQLEDIGARVLASLLRPVAGCSSQLRSLHLQHNRIGDDGAAALASALVGNSRLQDLWLHHNCVGPMGAQAFCSAMQNNTACMDLKLHPGNEGVPVQLAQAVGHLAKHNRGVRAHIRAVLKKVIS